MHKFSMISLGSILVILALTLIPSFAPLEAADTAARPNSATAQAQSGWEIFVPQSPATMYALDMIDETDGWAGGPEGFIMHWTGADWENFSTGFRKVTNGISMVNENSGWAATHSGDMLRYNGTAWSVHSKPGTSYLKDVYMLSETDGWVVGGVASSGQSTILRYNAGGDEWVQVGNPGVATLQAIDMVNASDGWAVGVGLTLLHWDGSNWLGGGLGPGILWDVDMLSSTNGWAVGSEGLIYHYNGSTWSQVTSPTDNDLFGVSMASASNGWAVGENGTILHYNGTAWQVASSPTTQALRAIEMVPPYDGWIVGYGGVVLQAVADLSPSTAAVYPQQAAVGERLTHTITVENLGAVAAPSVVVTDNTPANTTFVPGSATTSQGTIQGTDPLVVNLGDVAPDDQVVITFQVDVGNPGPLCWFVTNDAQVNSGGNELTRRSVAAIGDCYDVYVPLVYSGD